jgi:hypothetical protein
MKYAVVLALAAFAQIASAQATYTVDGFSDKYFGKVHLADPKEVFSPGWVAIYDKKTNRQLLKVKSDELTKEEHDGKVVANVKELPYGEQSSIIYEDYNFDGKKDFALMDGQNSCYHGPSFRIYLAAGSSFTFSPAFTKLAQENCGMFEIDRDKKRISTMTKSGCCYHEFSEYTVANNRPVALKTVEESVNVNGLTVDYVEENRVGGRMVRKTYSNLMTGDLEAKIVYSLELANKKKMFLINSDGRLSYAFTDPEDRIELMYSGPFDYVKEADVLGFTSGKTRYEISADGIFVKSPKLSQKMNSGRGTVKGSLANLRDAKIENVTIK